MLYHHCCEVSANDRKAFGIGQLNFLFTAMRISRISFHYKVWTCQFRNCPFGDKEITKISYLHYVGIAILIRGCFVMNQAQDLSENTVGLWVYAQCEAPWKKTKWNRKQMPMKSFTYSVSWPIFIFNYHWKSLSCLCPYTLLKTILLDISLFLIL